MNPCCASVVIESLLGGFDSPFHDRIEERALKVEDLKVLKSATFIGKSTRYARQLLTGVKGYDAISFL